MSAVQNHWYLFKALKNVNCAKYVYANLWHIHNLCNGKNNMHLEVFLGQIFKSPTTESQNQTLTRLGTQALILL